MGTTFYDWATSDVISAARLNKPWTATGRIEGSEVGGVELEDNKATAYTMAEGANVYMTAITSDGVANERMDFGKQVSISGASRVRVFQNYNLGVVTATETEIDFTTKSYDNLSEFDTATNEFIPKQTGYYLIYVQARLSSMATGKIGQLKIKVAGTSVADQTFYAYGAANLSMTVTTIAKVTAGQTVIAYVEHDSGVNKNLTGEAAGDTTFMCIHRLS